MQIEILTPASNIYSGSAEAVSLPGLNGVFQVLNGHAAIISALKKGIINIDLSEEFDSQRFTSEQISPIDTNKISVAISGGVVELQNDKMIILAE